MKDPPVAAHGRHRVGRAKVLALERDASKQEDATVAEILPVARCREHRYKFLAGSYQIFVSFSHKIEKMDSGGVEELYRNYGILADAKDNAGEVSILCE